MTEEIKQPVEKKEEKPVNTGISRNEKGQFKPGTSGNPAGKPKGSVSPLAILKRLLSEIPKGEKIVRGETLAKQILKMAITDKSEQMIKLILNYVEGMPKQSIDFKGEIEQPDNKLDKLLEDAKPEVRKQFNELLDKILPDKRRNGGTE